MKVNYQSELIKKLHEQTASIGIIGLGYVGLPLALRFSEAGFRVLGFDIDPVKPQKIATGRTYFKHLPDERVSSAVASGFTATTDFSRISEVDAVVICVPTPLKEDREPDISYIINTMNSIVDFLRPGQVVSLESTTYPGTTEEELRPRLEQTGFEIGVDCFLLFSPEREDPGNPNFSTRTIPKVVSGSTPRCLEVGKVLYQAVIDRVVPVSSTRVAEMSKLLENIHRAVNIGLVNEIKMVADKMDIDIYEVIEAAATKPFGFVPYYPGPGLGGHCIPIDPFYLTWKAKQYGVDTRFIELAGEVNSNMPHWVITKVAAALLEAGKNIEGSSILMLGIAYKKNIDDVRESPSVEIMQQLREMGAKIEYCDPYIPVFPKMRNYDFDLSTQALTAESLQEFDCVILGVDHDSFDYPLIAHYSEMVIDTRGRLRRFSGNIIQA